jgi:hypothetical protein
MADLVVGTRPVPQIELVPGSVRKVCQLTGEWDRQRHSPAYNRTETRFGLVGTDLGASFEHDGRLWFLFGDTWPDAEGGDSVAWTTDRTPEPGIGLEFVSAGRRFAPSRVSASDGRPVSTTFFEVPLDGFSAGGHMYVFRTTEHYREAGREVMGRSILTRAVDGDPTNLVCLYDLSIARRGGKFINVSCVVVDDGMEGLPFRDASLACVPLGAVEDRGRWRFWCGREARSRRPVWSESESDAVALFAHPQIGELSATWNAPLGMWLLLYNAGSPRGINARVARHPWGPWSDPVVVFDPGWAGTGYGEFMHVQDAPDGLSDPGRENEWGGEYGPYVIDRFTRDLPAGRAAVYYTMSTWNPYNVMAMTMILQPGAGSP